ncbi:VanW family protein [Salibacterium halotolerans]|uniref:VanW like protein n=1 Tax=Salibacterium halotolerans TaxID=1884432 RepID=A0A1I5ST11_9BACI|nr:VanW family protein [Salibacterium halotolerans]SFP73828.1 VanW like protein [Salibacterium halotolerans]
MKRNRYIEKSMLLFTCLTGVILFFSIGGAAAYEYVWPEEEMLPDEAEAGGVDIGGMKRSEAEEAVSDAWENWQERSGVALQLFNEEVMIEGERFEAEVEETVEQAFTDQNVLLQVSWTDEGNVLPEALDRFTYENLRDRVDMTALNEQVTMIGNISGQKKAAQDIRSFFIEEMPLETTTFNNVTLTPDVPGTGLKDWADALDGYEMEGGSIFSLLKALEEGGSTVYNDPGLDALASGVFQVLAVTNFEMSERHINEELPSYAAPGEDAHIEVPDRDLMFHNPNIYSYRWNASWNGSELSLSLSGPEFLHSYELERRKEETLEPRTVVRVDENRTTGGRRTLREGENGYYAEAVRVVANADANVLQETVLGRDYYPPEQRIVEKSLQTSDESGSSPPDIEPPESSGGVSSGNSEEAPEENGGDSGASDSPDSSQLENAGETEESGSGGEDTSDTENRKDFNERMKQNDQPIKGYE